MSTYTQKVPDVTAAVAQTYPISEIHSAREHGAIPPHLLEMQRRVLNVIMQFVQNRIHLKLRRLWQQCVFAIESRGLHQLLYTTQEEQW